MELADLKRPIATFLRISMTERQVTIRVPRRDETRLRLRDGKFDSASDHALCFTALEIFEIASSNDLLSSYSGTDLLIYLFI